jgi:hypothetical protein
MKRALLAAMAAVLFAAGNGCHWQHKPHGGHGCGPGCTSCSAPAPGVNGPGVPYSPVAHHVACGHAGPCSDECPCHQPNYNQCFIGPQRAGLLSRVPSDGGGAMGPADPMDQYEPTPPPSAAAVAYPYYTVRGPRDFLAARPRSIGP